MFSLWVWKYFGCLECDFPSSSGFDCEFQKPVIMEVMLLFRRMPGDAESKYKNLLFSKTLISKSAMLSQLLFDEEDKNTRYINATREGSKSR